MWLSAKDVVGQRQKHVMVLLKSRIHLSANIAIVVAWSFDFIKINLDSLIINRHDWLSIATPTTFGTGARDDSGILDLSTIHVYQGHPDS